MIACQKGNRDAINILLHARADPNIIDGFGATCIHHAVGEGCSKEVVETIVNHSADVNATNKKNITALMIACTKGNKDVTIVLLDAGADTNISDTKGDTCLHCAAQKERCTEILQAIISSHSIDVNVVNQKNVTALMIACGKGNEEAINVLLNAGADPHIANDYGDTCLHAAVEGNCSKDVLQKILSHGSGVNTTNKKNVTALMIACGKRNEEAINVLLNSGADPLIANDYGETCLHAAVEGDCSKDVLQKIINHGAVVNATNKKNVTTLMLACEKGNKDAINLLLDVGADPNIADADGDTWLNYAAYGHRSKEVLPTIFNHGAELNTTNKNNITALMIASQKGNADGISILMNAGADPNITDNKGATCIHHAVGGGCSKDVLERIVNHDADVNVANKKNITALMLACMKGSKDAINVLLNTGADPNIANTDGDTCLHYAVRNDCSTEVLEAIISHSVDVNATNKKNETTLMIACEKGNKDSINVLLNAGADPHIANDYGDIWIHAAVKGYCSKEVLQIIINHDTDVNATNKKNVTALMIACEKGNKDAINLLLDAGADPNISNADDDTCLQYAVYGDCCKEVLQAIICYGADVNATNKKNVTALMIACYKGNTDTINLLLNSGADHNITDGKGATCILHAILGGCSKDVLETFVNRSVDVNAANKNKVTALMLACEKGKKDIINVLLNAGADPSITDGKGATCIHYAVEGCRKDVLERIVNLGADVNATNKNNITALIIACQKGNVDGISILLNAGADPNITDKNGATCIHHAVGGGCNKDVLERIVNHDADVNVANKKNITALMLACMKENKDAINVLLNTGADPNIANTDGDTCLHYAVDEDCSKDVLEAILIPGVNVNAINKNNRTALMLACEKGNKDAINVLLNSGSDSNIADADGDTCLHYAVRNDCCIEVLQVIISHSADVNAANISNVTALMIACQKGNVDAINALLNAGADTNIADADGYTCLYKAIGASCSKQTLQAIIDHGADVNVTDKTTTTALMNACQMGNEDAIDVLLHVLADINNSDTDCYTCLHKAVSAGCNKQVIQAMIDCGVDVNATSNQNKTALMWACEKGNVDAINVLLDAGADPNVLDAEGHSCLHYGVLLNCSEEVLQTLIDHDADMNATNTTNITALMVACQKGNEDAINVLLKGGADPNVTDSNSATCTHHAVDEGCSKEVLQELIDHGADVNARTKNNVTSLMLACATGNKDAMTVFLNAGADTAIADVHGDTCLHKLFHTKCNQETLQILLDHGVTVNATNKNNETAYMLACDQGNADAMSALVNAGADSGDDTGKCCGRYFNSLTLQTRGQWLKSNLTSRYSHINTLSTETLESN